MMKQYQSPIQRAIKQQQYSKHLQRIDHILRRHKTSDYFQTQVDSHVRHSFHQHSNKQSQQIISYNLKHNKKLDEIRGRKSSSIGKVNNGESNSPSPYKKKEQKRIEQENLKIIDKIITMKCTNSYEKVKKDVEEYKKVRDRLKHNKSANVKLPSYKTMQVRVKLERHTPLIE